MSILFYRNTVKLHLNGPVEKGRKWRFEVKIEIAPIQLNIGTWGAFHLQNTVVHSFLDLRSKIWRIGILLLRGKFCWTELTQVKREWFLLFSPWTKTKEFNLESAVLLFSLCQFKRIVLILQTEALRSRNKCTTIHVPYTKTSLCANVQLNSTNLHFQPVIITYALLPPGKKGISQFKNYISLQIQRKTWPHPTDCYFFFKFPTSISVTREKWRRGGVNVQTNFHSEDQRIHGSRLISASAEKMLHSTLFCDPIWENQSKRKLHWNAFQQIFNALWMHCNTLIMILNAYEHFFTNSWNARNIPKCWGMLW